MRACGSECRHFPDSYPQAGHTVDMTSANLPAWLRTTTTAPTMRATATRDHNLDRAALMQFANTIGRNVLRTRSFGHLRRLASRSRWLHQSRLSNPAVKDNFFGPLDD